MVAIVAGLGVAGDLTYSSLKGQANQLQAQLTDHLRIAQAELEAAKASLKQANAKGDPGLVAQAKVHFVLAGYQFQATRKLADNSQLLRQVEQLPVVKDIARSRHVAVDGIADMGIAIASAGLILSDLDLQLIKPTSTGGSQGNTLLSVLDLASKSLVTVRTELDRAAAAAAGVDVGVLPAGQQATFLKARATIASALAGFDKFAALIPVMQEVLGGNGVRTYLVEQVNPSELRAGGGFIGTYSVLRADHGNLTLVRSGDAYDLSLPRAELGHPGYVQPTGPVKELLGGTSSSFIDSNTYPDFPSNARDGEYFAQPKLGYNADAVIAMDYYTVAKLLELTGPMPVPGYRLTVDSTNFVSLLFQYEASPAHKAILAAIAGPLMQRISTLPPSRWPALLSALNDLASERHLQLYFNNQSVEQAMTGFGWSGIVNPTASSEYMMEVESNLGATKANYLLTRQFTVELTRSGNTLHHKITVDFVNNMPYYLRPLDYYRAYISLFVNARASSLSDNLPPEKYGTPDPPPREQVVGGWLTIPGYGNRGKAVFNYDTQWKAADRGRDQIYWQKQPGTANDALTVIWTDGSGHMYKVTGNLTQDRIIVISPGGVTVANGQAGQATLPSLSLG